MKKISILSTLILLTIQIYAQDQSDNAPIKAFKIEERFLSSLDIPAMKLKDHPERAYFQKRLYKGTDLSVYILASETAINEINNFSIDEFVYYINGRADIKPQEGEAYSFYSGDYLFVPKGFSGTWTNNGGNKYHLELSVISNKRSDSTMVSQADQPFILDKELMSGIGINTLDADSFRSSLYSGVELAVFVEAEKPNKRTIIDNEQEQFIHVLNGLVNIQATNGEVQTFYQGDFFILPSGFTGSWESQANGNARFLKVIQK